MATYADNTVFLKIDSVEVDAYFVDVDLTGSNSPVDTTAGSGTDWNMRAPGLNDASINITLMYDVSAVQTYIQKIAPGARGQPVPLPAPAATTVPPAAKPQPEAAS